MAHANLSCQANHLTLPLMSPLCSIYTSYLLAAMHEQPDGTRLNTYREIGEAILGKSSWWCGLEGCTGHPACHERKAHRGFGEAIILGGQML